MILERTDAEVQLVNPDATWQAILIMAKWALNYHDNERPIPRGYMRPSLRIDGHWYDAEPLSWAETMTVGGGGALMCYPASRLGYAPQEITTKPTKFVWLTKCSRRTLPKDLQVQQWYATEVAGAADKVLRYIDLRDGEERYDLRLFPYHAAHSMAQLADPPAYPGQR